MPSGGSDSTLRHPLPSRRLWETDRAEEIGKPRPDPGAVGCGIPAGLMWLRPFPISVTWEGGAGLVWSHQAPLSWGTQRQEETHYQRPGLGQLQGHWNQDIGVHHCLPLNPGSGGERAHAMGWWGTVLRAGVPGEEELRALVDTP